MQGTRREKRIGNGNGDRKKRQWNHMTCSNENQQRNAGKMRVVWRIEKRKGHATPGLMLRKRNPPTCHVFNVLFFCFSVLSLPLSTISL
jgi:hypothetical protein